MCAERWLNQAVQINDADKKIEKWDEKWNQCDDEKFNIFLLIDAMNMSFRFISVKLKHFNFSTRTYVQVLNDATWLDTAHSTKMICNWDDNIVNNETLCNAYGNMKHRNTKREFT